MDTIKERNNPDPAFIFLILLMFGGNIVTYFWHSPSLFYCGTLITFFICVFLYFRSIEFFIDKNKIKIKRVFFLIPYNIITIEFDSVTESSLDTLTFYKNKTDVLTLKYVDDISESTYILGYIEIIQGTITHDVGNKKSSYNLFKKIKTAILNHNTLANT